MSFWTHMDRVWLIHGVGYFKQWVPRIKGRLWDEQIVGRQIRIAARDAGPAHWRGARHVVQLHGVAECACLVGPVLSLVAEPKAEANTNI